MKPIPEDTCFWNKDFSIAYCSHWEVITGILRTFYQVLF